jgi:curli biogenesis system outer membrane secretion channel CsgG
MKTIARLVVVACAALTACNAPAPQASAPPTPGSVAVTPPGFQLPEGTDCSGKIARYRAVQDNDLSMGHVAQSVYNQIKRETDAASKVCAAGRDAEAKSMVASSQRRHGYPTDL